MNEVITWHGVHPIMSCESTVTVAQKGHSFCKICSFVETLIFSNNLLSFHNSNLISMDTRYVAYN